MYPNSIRNLIECLKDLPGIGEKSAERLAFSILNFDPEKLDCFSEAISSVKNIKKCPICNNQAKREYYTGPFGIEEEYIDCSTCNYEFEFAYGNYKEVVGNKYFIWSHSTKYDNPIFKRMSRTEFMAKRRWKKHHKGTTCKDCPV